MPTNATAQASKDAKEPKVFEAWLLFQVNQETLVFQDLQDQKGRKEQMESMEL